MNQNELKTVLVVEDDPPSKQYLLLLLKKLNYSALAVNSGEEAMQLMGNKVVDIMLLDIALGPGMSGIELGKNLRNDERHAATPMIAVSAFTKEKVKDLSEAGFADYLSKPYTIVQLKELLDKHL